MIDSSKMADRCIYTALIVAALFTICFWGDWWIVACAWLLMYPLAMLLGLITGFVGSWLDWKVEHPQVWTDETDIVITERSEEIVGMFQDAIIHEWVILKRPDTGEPLKCLYKRSFDMSKSDFSFTPPENTWFCVLPPGILYVAAEPENAESSA